LSGPPSFAVVGANGFIGSRIVEVLHLERGARVRPVVRRASGLALSSRFGLEGRIADALDTRAMEAALSGCDVVIHAVAGDPRTIVRSVEPVYRAAEAAGCRRLVYLSSAMVHGQAPPPNVDEKSPLAQRQAIPYNGAKVRAEETLFRLRRRGKLEAVALRPGIVFGPRSSWIGDFADALLAGDAYLVGGGEGICNAIYVDNLVHAIELAARVEKADGEAFLIGENERMTWRELYRPIVEALGSDLSAVAFPELENAPRPSLKEKLDALRLSSPVQSVLEALPQGLRRAIGAFWSASGALPDTPARPRPTPEMALLHGSRNVPSFEKARSVLGYQPVVSRSEGIRRTIGWLAFAGYPICADLRKEG
jgi:nucleoside-diphosphate-sugar epimerase